MSFQFCLTVYFEGDLFRSYMGEGGGELRFFPSPKAYMVEELGIPPSPRAYMGVPDPIYRHIFSYSFIFWTYFFILLHIISSYFLHIYYIKEFPYVTSSGGEVKGVLVNPEITQAEHKT